jgi:recombination protein RecA
MSKKVVKKKKAAPTEEISKVEEIKEVVKVTATKQKAANAAVAAVRKLFGDDSIGTLTGAAKGGSCVSTGYQELDDILTGEQVKDEKSNDLTTVAGSGRGLPKGRIVEVFGPESCGKTTLTLIMIRAFQQAGLVAAFVDAEHALDAPYAQKIGVDMEALLLSQPNSAEQALNIVSTLARSKGVDLIVVDSVAALVPERELSEKKTPMPGEHAALMSRHLRKLIQYCASSGSIVVFINQLRMKIGVMFGNPETTTGGNALKFYASLRLDIRRTKTLKKGDKATGIRSRIRVVKNKVAPPFREIYVEMSGGKGITRVYAEEEE